MSIKISSFGGRVGWIAHKYLSRRLIPLWLWMTEKNRKRDTYTYVNRFINMKEAPLFKMVEIETVNRCNGTCSFCPANIHDESRPFQKMKAEVFYKIIDELKEIDYEGDVLLEVNNEPLIDSRLVEFANYIKENVTRCTVAIITNGTLLTVEKIIQLSKCMDRITINNYSEKYALNDNLRIVYDYIKKNPKEFENIEIEIRRRYVKEVLTNRAGAAPNKRGEGHAVTIPCLYPFVGITIFPNGNVGLCSNDCFEKTNYGNVRDESLMSIWNGDKIRAARTAIASGRKNYEICRKCDVIGIGTREKLASEEN